MIFNEIYFFGNKISCKSWERHWMLGAWEQREGRRESQRLPGVRRETDLREGHFRPFVVVVRLQEGHKFFLFFFCKPDLWKFSKKNQIREAKCEEEKPPIEFVKLVKLQKFYLYIFGFRGVCQNSQAGRQRQANNLFFPQRLRLRLCNVLEHTQRKDDEFHLSVGQAKPTIKSEKVS